MDKQSKEMRELDAWLAENPMKWHTDISKSFYFDSRNRLGMSVVYWHPTTNIAQAMMVKDKMKEDGYDFELYEYCDDETQAIFIKSNPQNMGIGDNASTALAICLAAKKAWEAK